jgi:FtsH-binding integral membrane protein
MASAALSPAALPEAPGTEIKLYVRAVWAKLGAGAFFAAATAWLAAMAPPLRSAIILERDGEIVGLGVLGVALAASPLLIWAAARVLARAPMPLVTPFLFWLLAAATGAAANTLALLFLHDSVVSVFVLAAVGFAAINLAHRVLRQPPAWTSAALFLAVSLAGGSTINAVLHGTWAFTAVDLAALGIFTLLIAARGGALARICATLARPNAKSGVTFAAMHVLTLANVPSRAVQAPS